MGKIVIQENILRYFYEKKRLTDGEISELLEVSSDVVTERRKDYGIKSRSYKEAQNIAWDKGKYTNRNIENIRKACRNMGEKFGKLNGGKNKKHENRFCPQCSKEFYPSKRNQLCCSKECMKGYYVGEKHWAYLHGRTLQTGIGWQRARKEVVKYYNGICQNCGKDGNIVHHIYPRRFYQNVNNSNVFINLTLLCEHCHRVIDAKLRWHRKEGEVRESLKRVIVMVTLSQVLSEMVRKVQRLMDEAKSKIRIC